MLEEAKRIYNQKNIEIQYIIINVVVFLIVTIANSLTHFKVFPFLLASDGLAIPASVAALALKPWTIFTYMFTHQGFFHLFFNMIWLYFGGRIFSDLLGREKFIKTYWMGGIFGALFYLVAFNIAPDLITQNSVMIGASASVIAIFIAITVSVPDYTVMLPFIGPAKLKYIAIVFVIFSLPNTHGNEGGHLAHLGGLTWGFAWAYYYKRGTDIGSWFDSIVHWISPRISGISSRRKKPSKTRSTTSKTERRKNDLPNQQEIDKILDKVGKSGYESLTDDEKNTLFNASK